MLDRGKWMRVNYFVAIVVAALGWLWLFVWTFLHLF